MPLKRSGSGLRAEKMFIAGQILLACFLVHVISGQGFSIYRSGLGEEFSDRTRIVDVRARFVVED